MGEFRIANETTRYLSRKNAIASIMDQAKFAKYNIAGGWGNHMPHPGIATSYRSLLDEHSFSAATRYSETSGMPGLKQAICHKLELGYFGRTGCTPENITISTGSTMATYQLITLLCGQEKSLLTTDPVYANVIDQCDLIGTKIDLLQVFEKNGEFLPETMPDKVIVRYCNMLDTGNVGAVYLVSPCNPMSRFYPDSFLDKLIRLAAERNIPVIIDGAYAVFYYDDRPKQLTFSRIEYPNLIRLESFSKTFSLLGERIGYVVADKTVSRSLAALTQRITLCPNRLPQEVMTLFLNDIPPVDLAEYITDARKQYSDVSQIVMNTMLNYGIKFIKPNGGFYVTFQLPPPTGDDRKFCDTLLDNTGILAVPGSAFGNSLSGWVRTSFAPYVRDRAKVREIYELLAKYITEVS